MFLKEQPIGVCGSGGHADLLTAGTLADHESPAQGGATQVSQTPNAHTRVPVPPNAALGRDLVGSTRTREGAAPGTPHPLLGLLPRGERGSGQGSCSGVGQGGSRGPSRLGMGGWGRADPAGAKWRCSIRTAGRGLQSPPGLPRHLRRRSVEAGGRGRGRSEKPSRRPDTGHQSLLRGVQGPGGTRRWGAGWGHRDGAAPTPGSPGLADPPGTTAPLGAACMRMFWFVGLCPHPPGRAVWGLQGLKPQRRAAGPLNPAPHQRSTLARWHLWGSNQVRGEWTAQAATTSRKERYPSARAHAGPSLRSGQGSPGPRTAPALEPT